ncbi:phosphatidylinositol kinase- protein kinase tor1 [Mycoemilia scoparia]|uniref:non-specific serine/threonine protein kinase n=1 Tax=Mycoemilia scoparia TaxID=417184 RepID=A0A9W8DR24_9FUNG|nr:phosphatidylinositol kinase- protein kinase tor1 [Mycoemilia scoparia]
MMQATKSGESAYENVINAMIQSLKLYTSRSDLKSKLTTVGILSVLVMQESLDDAQFERMANLLHYLLGYSDMVINREVVDIFGHLLRKTGAMANASLDTEIKRCLEWLQGEKNEYRILTALLFIKTCCQRSQSFTNNYVPQILDSLPPLIKDPKKDVRITAVEALSACLKLIAPRESQTKTQWFTQLYVDAMQNLRSETVEGQHAALLVFRELISHSGMFMRSRFVETTEVLLRYKDSKDLDIRKLVMDMLPKFAQYYPSEFIRPRGPNVDSFLQQSCNWLIELNNYDKVRPYAFASLAGLADACKSDFKPFLEVTIMAAKGILVLSNVNASIDPKPVLFLIHDLAYSMGPALTKYMHEILDLMFDTGLSYPLCKALSALKREVNQLSVVIQDQLINTISLVLAGEPFRVESAAITNLENKFQSNMLASPTVPGTPIDGSFNFGKSNSNSSATNDKIPAIPTTDDIVMALNILGNFGFDRENMSVFIQKVVLPFLNDADKIVRSTAINAVSNIILNDEMYMKPGSPATEVTNDITQHLIAVAATDIEVDVRVKAAKTLLEGTCLDFILIKSENIQSLMLILNDSCFEVKTIILNILGRLATNNPAHTTSTLRRIIVQLLTELEHVQETQEKDECIQLIMTMVQSAETWIRSYVNKIFLTILPMANDPNPQLAGRFLDTIGLLAYVGGEDLIPYTKEIMDHITAALKDKPNQKKRLSALTALGRCASFCGLVISPYYRYPDLLDTLADMLQNETNEEIRIECIRVLGILGAIDPHEIKQIKEGVRNKKPAKYPGTKPRFGHFQTLYGGTTVGLNGRNNARRLRRIEMEVADDWERTGKYMNRLNKAAKTSSMPTEASAADSSNVDKDTTSADYELDANLEEEDKLGPNNPNILFGNADNYTAISIKYMLDVLQNPQYRAYHKDAVKALINMFTSISLCRSTYLKPVLPALIKAMKENKGENLEFYIEQLAKFVAASKEYIRPFLGPLFELFKIRTDAPPSQLLTTISLIEVIAEAQSGDFAPHLPTVIPFLLKVMINDRSNNFDLIRRALHAFQVMAPGLDAYLYLVMPKILWILEANDKPQNVIEEALVTVTVLISQINCHTFASRIVQSLIKLLLTTQSQILVEKIVDVFCVLMQQLQDNFVIFMPKISSAMSAKKMQRHQKYEYYSNQLFTNKLVMQPVRLVQSSIMSDVLIAKSTYPNEIPPKEKIHIPSLRRAWSTNQKSTRSDWNEWLRVLNFELIAQSPSPALRACATLTNRFYKLSTEMFNHAFMSCWEALSEQYKTELVRAVDEAASSENVSSDVLLTILNLAEYMERNDKQTPISLKKLNQFARKCNALAKALHYTEIQWTTQRLHSSIAELIDLNHQLDLTDAAIGTLNYVKKIMPDSADRVKWYVRLEQWDEALDIYRQKEKDHGYILANAVGQMECLERMSDWETLMPMIKKAWKEGPQILRENTASIAVNMSLSIGDFEGMTEYVSTLDDKYKSHKIFCKALLAVHNGDYETAKALINEGRSFIENDLSSILNESYSRSYDQMIICQMLSELEEVIVFKHMNNQIERQDVIVNTWRKRLAGMQRNIDVWHKTLLIRSLALPPSADMDTWIRFIDLCRRNNQLELCRQTIEMLVREEYDCFQLEAAQREGSPPPQNIASLYGRRYISVSSTNFPSQNFHPRLDTREGVPIMEDWLRRYCQPALIYTYLKYKWDLGKRVEAYRLLDEVKRDLSAQIGFDPCHPELFLLSLDRMQGANNGVQDSPSVNGSMSPPGNSTPFQGLSVTNSITAQTLQGMGWEDDAELDIEQVHTLARFYFKSGEWLSRIHAEQERAKESLRNSKNGNGNGNKKSRRNKRSDTLAIPQHQRQSILVDAATLVVETTVELSSLSLNSMSDAPHMSVKDQILEAYRMATVLDRKWYKAWHALALRHYEDTQAYEREKNAITTDIIEKHVIPSVHGFFKAIQLSETNTTLQDTLRLLTVWFNYGKFELVSKNILMGFNDVKITTWLQVIPQIIARIHTPYEKVRDLVVQLLVEVGKYHPQAILFSLTVASKSEFGLRRDAAMSILQKLRDHNPGLIQEADMVSGELVRITELWFEHWYYGLEETSNLYFRHNDLVGMFQKLKVLYDLFQNGPETHRDLAFIQQYGRELEEAAELIKRFLQQPESARNMNLIYQAWDIYAPMYYKLEKIVKSKSSIDLKSASPKLYKCRNLKVAVPGTYDPDKPLISIAKFYPELKVFPSKQRPRLLNLFGDDGKRYCFILKGHEDIRQDERVMQFFELINTLLNRDANTARRQLGIERFPAIPLSPTSGLLGFYANCDTINELVTQFRQRYGIPLSDEHAKIKTLLPDIEHCTIIQRIEGFEHVMETTEGMDLCKTMWYRSPSAEVWLERRTNYTRSLGVTSIAGYVLGLGDRHPSNIMIHSQTGKVVHIDFGDCFEAARNRDSFPELIPFRLTRMLILAMEVNSLEGSFKITCQHTMRVLRANRDSLMAVLEAFVYDPLVSWHYLQDEKTKKKNATDNDDSLRNKKRYNEKELSKLSKEANQWQTANPKATAIIERISNKLTGHDFYSDYGLETPEQVDKLIRQATYIENLCQTYPGWCAMW